VTGQIDLGRLFGPQTDGTLAPMAQTKSMVPASVPRRELAQLLKDLRAASSLTLKEVAEQAEVDHGHLSRVERATRGISKELLGKLLDRPYARLATADERTRAFELLRADLAEEDPYKRHSNLLTPTQYGGYLKFEAGASALSAYELALLPGLLQTEEYAAAVIEAMRPDLSKRGVATLVDIRMQRQQRLIGAGKAFRVVIDEAALRRPVVAGEPMKQQLNRLIEIVEYPFVSVSLLPMTTGCHAGLYGSFMIMDFPEPTPSVVWVEGLAESTYFAKQDHVGRYVTAFESLWEHAVPLAADSDLIEKVIKELPK
jgi:transcriptional regulator with XRE-family HTH domain